MMTYLYYGDQNFEVAEFRSRKVIHELEMVMTAFDCVIPDDAGIYCSTNITTDRRLYFEIFRQYNVRSEEELAMKLGNDRYTKVKMEVMQSNMQRGLAFAESLRLRGFVNIITPAPFIAHDFNQQHYLYLWEWIIIKKAYEARFIEGWEFSNGCTMEYAAATHKGIPRFDHMGRQLKTSQAIRKIEAAVQELTACKISAGKLEYHLAYLKKLRPSNLDPVLAEGREQI
jgi:hypothetical protein